MREKSKTPELTTLDCYTNYLLRNKVIYENQRPVEVVKLHKEIAVALEDANKSDDANAKKIKLSKAHIQTVLSDFIKNSYTITYDGDDKPTESISIDEDTNTDDTYKDMSILAVREDFLADKGYLPVAQKNIAFNRKNEILDIWKSTEQKCNDFIRDGSYADILKKVFFVDGSSVNITTPKFIETLTRKEIEKQYPVERIMPRFTNKTYSTNVSLIQTNALSETMNRARRRIPCAYICASSQMIPGGGSDQGIETNETPLYLASSYSVCVDSLAYIYPLENTQFLVLPNILVFRDHTQPKYPLLRINDGQKISVICCAPKYRPSTNLPDQDRYGMDTRLYLPATKYTHPEKAFEQLTTVFNTALFFGYDTIILDDRGVEDFWLPCHHTASLLAECINTYRGKFKEIVIAIDKPHLYNIYKTYIN